jgi:hypothetical protein
MLLSRGEVELPDLQIQLGYLFGEPFDVVLNRLRGDVGVYGVDLLADERLSRLGGFIPQVLPAQEGHRAMDDRLAIGKMGEGWVGT